MVNSLSPIGRLPADQRLKLAIGLSARNEAQLDQLLQQLYDPTAPNYRQFLSPAEFTDQFGPTVAEYKALIEFMIANGLTVTQTHPNRMVLDVEGSVGDIEKLLQVTLAVYAHPTEARTFFAPDREPSLATEVRVLNIEGLNSYWLPHPGHQAPSPESGTGMTPRGGSGPSGSYRGRDLRAAYIPGTILTGAGQSVGLLQFDGYYPSDITTYESQVGLASVTLIDVPVDGGVAKPGNGNSEVCLDIEMAISMAPGLAAVYVYMAPNPSPWVDLLSRMANDNLAKQLSCSWGGGSQNPAAENIFKQMAAQGQSFFNASGDSGAFTGPVTFPSDSTNITQVGGTTLSTAGPEGAYVSEIVWNQGGGVGSGGGISTYYGIPSYQLGVSMSVPQGSSTMRNVPDVAMVAQNLYVVYNNGSSGRFSGTSAAAPLWAGFTALVNQQAAGAGRAPIGFLNPAVYAIGKSAGYATSFHDTTAGNNFPSAGSSLFSATNGYDLCTGWGSPNGTNLIDALAGPPLVTPVLVASNYTLVAELCTNGVVDPGETVTVAFSLANVGGANVTNLIASLQASNGVTLPDAAKSYGTVPAGAGPVTQLFSFTASGDCGSSIVATLHLQDRANDFGLLSYTIPLGQAVQPLAQNWDSVTPPALPTGWTKAATGGGTNWVTSSGLRDSPPNSAFAGEPVLPGVGDLISPAVSITTTSAALAFRQSYNLEADPVVSTKAYDGGVLEIKIGTGQFADVVTAGGTFIAGGYNRTIDSGTDNALGSRPAWSGASGGFITTIVTLPAAAAGNSVQFKWRLGTDTANGYGGSGWYLDSIAITDGYACCTFNPHIAPVISANALKLSQTNVSLSVTSVIGGVYTLEYKNTLLDPAWTPIAPSVAGTGEVISLQDTNGAKFPSRFYRVNLQ